MKRLVSVLFAFALVLCLVFSLASCGEEKHTHSLTHHETKGATCTEDGNIEYWRCEICKKYYAEESATTELVLADIIIGAEGHEFSNDWTIDSEGHWHSAICGHDAKSEYGVHEFVDGYCTVCSTKGFKATVGLAYDLNEDGASYRVVGIGSATDTEIVIPDTYNGLPVTAIAEDAFRDHYGIVSVVIGDSVISIGKNAFNGCNGVMSVVIGDGVTTIGIQAFANCSRLLSVVIGDSVIRIGEGAFSFNTIVEVINKSSLPITEGSENYGYIAYNAIEVHSEESKIENVGDYMFYRSCGGANCLVGYLGEDTELTLPESYKGENYEIYSEAFRNCSYYSLTSVVIPDSVTSIGDSAFFGCNLTSIVISDRATLPSLHPQNNYCTL